MIFVSRDALFHAHLVDITVKPLFVQISANIIAGSRRAALLTVWVHPIIPVEFKDEFYYTYWFSN